MASDANDETTLWQTRAAIYEHFADTGRPPAVEEAAEILKLTVAEVSALYHELHDCHALFLQPGSDPPAVLMANPFSAVETGFRVWANRRGYWANCAWDSFGIAAALGADAQIEAKLPSSGETIRLAVVDGSVVGSDEAPDAAVHILLPFAHWYDDLVYT